MITNGFYEWKKPEKQPYGVAKAADDLMVMAGRMPVVLAGRDWPKWLGEEPATPDELKALLVPCPDDLLKMWPIDRQKIGNVRTKASEVAEPVVRF